MDLNWKEYNRMQYGYRELGETSDNKEGLFEFQQSFVGYEVLLEMIRKVYIHLKCGFLKCIRLPFAEEMRA